MELNVHSKSVHAAHWGESINPALVMVHGAGGNHAVWSLVAPNVAAEGYYVLAPDLPGHGLSEGEALTSIPALADWLTAFLDAAGLQRVILAGHSMGALAALDCAARHSDRVCQLVLLGSAAAMPVHEALLEAARTDPAAAAALIAKWGFAKEPPPPPSLVAELAGRLAACAPGILFTDLAACDAYASGAARAAETACPATIIIGGQDRMAPADAGENLALALPLGRVITIAAGHMMMEEHPQATADALLAALDRGLDPGDWQALREEAHRMLDQSLDFIASVRRRPVWQPMPEEVRARFDAGTPRDGQSLAEINDEFRRVIEPYGPGNLHPGFMGWVHGGGTVEGMLAEMLAGGLNANLGGRDHAPIEVERQILRWMRRLFGYPDTASGLFLTGTSLANFLAVLVARSKTLGPDVRNSGLTTDDRLTAYASVAAHGCIRQAFEMAGMGADCLRLIATDAAQRMDTEALRSAIAADRAAGSAPFMIIGNAGTVDTGAIDDLSLLADIAAAEAMWFHVDGAYAALGMMSPDLAPLLAGIERTDSLAFDFHKWGQVPYDAGYLLVRDGEAHRATFASPAAYLRRETRGLAGGSPWPCDFGPDLSRGFRALKTWVTLKAHGMDRLGAAMAGTCRVARHLGRRIEAEPRLELLAPVGLNIVCFRHRAPDADRLNAHIVTRLHETGIAAPSTTTIDGKLAIRAAIVNHRTRESDVDRLLSAVLDLGAKQ